MQSAKLGVLQREARGTRNVKGFFTMGCRYESDKVQAGPNVIWSTYAGLQAKPL